MHANLSLMPGVGVAFGEIRPDQVLHLPLVESIRFSDDRASRDIVVEHDTDLNEIRILLCRPDPNHEIAEPCECIWSCLL